MTHCTVSLTQKAVSLTLVSTGLIRPGVVWEPFGGSGIGASVASGSVAPGSSCFIGSPTCPMSVAVLVSEGQTVVALTALLGVSRIESTVSSIVSTIVSIVAASVINPVGVSAVVPAVVSIIVSVIVSTIASAVIVSTASEQGVETKEPGSWLILTRRLPFPSSTVAPVGSAAAKKGPEEFCVRSFSLSPSSSTRIVVIAVEESTQDASTDETKPCTDESTVERFVTGENLGIRVLCVGVILCC